MKPRLIRKEPKSEDKIDLLAKVIPSLVAVAGVIVGVWQFHAKQQQEETLEFRRKLWEQRMNTYSRLSETTGAIIIYRNDATALDSLSKTFQRMYYAAMPMVQDEAVEQKLIDFNLALIDFLEKKKDEQYLKSKQIQLMKELGVSLKRTSEILEE